MYYYIYDAFLNKPKFNKTLARLESRLINLGLNGKTTQLSAIKSLGEAAEEAINKGAKTIVVIGNDQTVSRAINALAGTKVVLGVIPMSLPNNIARVLGLSTPEEACNIISARRVKNVNLGQINDGYFLIEANINTPGVILECENKFQVQAQGKKQTIHIYNLQPGKANRRRNRLGVVIDPAIHSWLSLRPSAERETIFPVKNIRVRAEKSIPILIDGQTVYKSPAKIQVVPKKLQIIVGKERLF